MTAEQLPKFITVIKDPLIEPFFIGRDLNCYTVYQTLFPGFNQNQRGRKTRAKESVKALAYYSNIGSCLSLIAHHKVEMQPEFTSIKDYIDQLNQFKENINQLAKFKI
jgi:hypothetical protein